MRLRTMRTESILVVCGLLMTAPAAVLSAQVRTLSRAELDRLRQVQRNAAPLQVIGPDRAVSLAGDPQRVTLDAGQYVRSTAPRQAGEVDGRKRYVLPVRFTGFDRSGQHRVRLAPVLEVEQKAMRLAPDGRGYWATVLVGLDDEESPGIGRQLERRTVIQLSADRAEIDRADLTIDSTGTPYERIRLTSTSPGDSIVVTLRFQGQRTQASIEVERPRIDATGLPNALPGLGVGDADVTFQLSEDAGSREYVVSVSLVPGTAEPNQVSISGTKPESVRLRTARLGQATLKATSTGLIPFEWPITLQFPWGFCASALIGGGLGSLCARLTRRNRSMRTLAKNFSAGVIFGVLGAAIYLLGVNLTGVPIPLMNNELAVIVIAALVGFGGEKALAKSPLGAGLEGAGDAADG